MPRYYFDLIVDGDRRPDTQGVVIDDEEKAYLLALDDVQVLARNAAGNLPDPAKCAIEVLDERRQLLFTVTLRNSLN